MSNPSSVLRQAVLSIAIVTVAAPWCGVTRASQVRPMNLEQMTERAATIFAGRCIDVREQHDPVVRRVTIATFLVDRAVKGDLGRTVTVRLLGGSGDGADRGLGVPGMPRFRVGDEVILFLYGESALGLSSPVGLGQGRFSIARDKTGRTIAVNEFGNRSLLTGLSRAARQRVQSALALRPGSEAALEPGGLLDLVDLLARPAGGAR